MNEKRYCICAVAIMAAFVGSVTLLFHEFPRKPVSGNWTSAAFTSKYFMMETSREIAVFAPPAGGIGISVERGVCTVKGYPPFPVKRKTIYVLRDGAVLEFPYSKEELERVKNTKPEAL